MSNPDQASDEATALTVDMYDQAADVFSGHFAGFRSCVPDVTRAHELAGIPLGKSRLVEVGCGEGRDAETAFVPNSEEYTGYDPSAGLLEIARKRFPGARPDMFQVGYAQTSEYPEDVDVAMAINSLLHVPKDDMPTALGRLAIVMNPGGVLHVVTKVEPTYNAETYSDDFIVDGKHVIGERQFYHYSPELLVGLAEAAGFDAGYVDIGEVEAKPWNWGIFGFQRKA